MNDEMNPEVEVEEVTAVDGTPVEDGMTEEEVVEPTA